MKKALIIPVYKNEESIENLIKAVRVISEEAKGRLAAVFVVDGSPDDSYIKLKKMLPAAGFNSKLIAHSRNFGSFEAIRTGMSKVEADIYAVLSADLQEPPELIFDFFEKIENDEADIVFGTRTGRSDSFFSNIFSAVFWWLYRMFVIKEVPKGGVDVFGCTRKVRDHIVSFRESNSSLVGQLFWVGFKRKFLPYKRKKREKGKSAWTFRKKINYLMDSVFAVTDLPIKFFIFWGTAGIIVSLFLGMFVVVSRFLGMIDVSGYAAIMATIIFFGALNILGIGIVGAYSHRAYENSKNRPLAITMEETEYEGQ